MDRASMFRERAAQYDLRANASETPEARRSYAALAGHCRGIAENLERLEAPLDGGRLRRAG